MGCVDAAARLKDQRAEVLQHDRIQLADFHGGTIETLHQVLARPPVGSVAQPHLRCERGLHVEHQPFLAPLRKVMQTYAQIVQKGFVFPQLALLRGG